MRLEPIRWRDAETGDTVLANLGDGAPTPVVVAKIFPPSGGGGLAAIWRDGKVSVHPYGCDEFTVARRAEPVEALMILVEAFGPGVEVVAERQQVTWLARHYRRVKR